MAASAVRTNCDHQHCVCFVGPFVSESCTRPAANAIDGRVSFPALVDTVTTSRRRQGGTPIAYNETSLVVVFACHAGHSGSSWEQMRKEQRVISSATANINSGEPRAQPRAQPCAYSCKKDIYQ